MRKNLQKKLNKVFELCVEITCNTEHDAFFTYHAHVNYFEVFYYPGGWRIQDRKLVPINEIGGQRITHKNLNDTLRKLKKLRVGEDVLL